LKQKKLFKTGHSQETKKCPHRRANWRF